MRKTELPGKRPKAYFLSNRATWAIAKTTQPRFRCPLRRPGKDGFHAVPVVRTLTDQIVAAWRVRLRVLSAGRTQKTIPATLAPGLQSIFNPANFAFSFSYVRAPRSSNIPRRKKKATS